MTGASIAIAVLLALALGTVLMGVVGLFVSKDFYERLHFMAPAATLGISLVAAAVVVKEGIAGNGLKAILIALLVFWTNSALTHATARAGRTEQYGNLDLRPEEKQNRVRHGGSSG